MFKPTSFAAFAVFAAINVSWAQDFNIYDPSYSSMINWGYADRGPDQTISISYGGTTATATTAVAVAGSVVSLKVGGKEFIASGGHGSGLSWAFHPQLPGYPSGECYNPTSGGTAGDDWRPGWNTPPYHGPSTSAILQPLSQRPIDELRSLVRLAFYVPQGWNGYGGCTANYPIERSPYYYSDEGYGNLSPFVMRQTVSFGLQAQGVGWVPNVLNVEGDITADNDALEHHKIYDNVSIAYLLPDFTNFYYFNPDPAAFDNGLHALNRASQGFYGSQLPVIATADGAYAIGVIEGQSAQEARNVQQGNLPPHNERHYYWMNYSDGSTYFPLQTLQATFYHTTPSGDDCSWASCENLAAGTKLRHTVHYVFGNLSQVQYALQVIYNSQHCNLDPDVFNWEEYISMYPSLGSDFPDQTRAQDDWFNLGILENRHGSYKFWAPAYRAANPDVDTYCQGSNSCAIAHYVSYGRNEHRPLWP
ncbi:MAG: hypothetical protein QOF24_1616 [Verrucomicrobiota bacterium]|jgi:hypothetical protein